MDYNDIVKKLKEKEEYYREEIFYTKEYVLARFYEEYSNVSEKNMDNVSLNGMITTIMIKLGLFDRNAGMISRLLNSYSSAIIRDIVINCLNGERKLSISNIEVFLKNIGEENKVLSVLPNFYDLVETFIDNVSTALSDPESRRLIERLMGYKYINDRLGDGMDMIQKRKLKSALTEMQTTDNIDLSEAYKILYLKIREYVNYAYEFSNGLTSKKISNRCSKYKNALMQFEEANKMDDMTMCLDAVSMIDDEELLKEIYLYINKHNMPNFIKVEAEYEEKSKNASYNYVEFFKGYGLDFSILDSNFQNKLMEDGIDITKTKLSVISKFADKENYFYLLAGSSLDTLLYIDKLFKDGYINYEFVNHNMHMFISSTIFETFKNNFELLVDRVNIKRYSDKSFLMSDTNILRDNILLLEKYDIPYKNCYDLSFLGKKLNEKLSLFIEVGLENEIYNNPDILNIDINLAKRVLLTRMVGEEVIENGKLIDLVINPDKFFVPASKVDYELERDNTKYNSTGVLYLSKLDSTKLSYMMDGVVIPKTRVDEQPIKLESIIKPSLYSKDEIKILEKNATK